MLVTIITVAYNSEATIEKTINSVLNQTYKDIEYIIIDGASKDNTVQVASKYIKEFERTGKKLSIISEPDNGMYDALNKGARLAKGEIVGNINADDWYELDAVWKMVELYQKTNYDLAWASINIIKDSGNMVKKAKIGKLWTTVGFCHPSMFTRREILLQYPYACLQMDDDFDMVTRVYKDKKHIELLDDVISNYSFGGMSTQKSFKKLKQRTAMKYRTYRRNGMSRFYWFYCFGMELAKYVLG